MAFTHSRNWIKQVPPRIGRPPDYHKQAVVRVDYDLRTGEVKDATVVLTTWPNAMPGLDVLEERYPAPVGHICTWHVIGLYHLVPTDPVNVDRFYHDAGFDEVKQHEDDNLNRDELRPIVEPNNNYDITRRHRR